MTLEIDFDNKVVKIKESVNVFKFLQKMTEFPDWQSWTLDVTSVVEWVNPTIVPTRYYPRWWEYPFITGASSMASSSKLTSSRTSTSYELKGKQTDSIALTGTYQIKI